MTDLLQQAVEPVHTTPELVIATARMLDERGAYEYMKTATRTAYHTSVNTMTEMFVAELLDFERGNTADAMNGLETLYIRVNQPPFRGFMFVEWLEKWLRHDGVMTHLEQMRDHGKRLSRITAADTEPDEEI